MPLRVLLVDDHPVFLEGLRALLANYPDVEIIGEAHDGQTALELTIKHRPDVVLMDLSIPNLPGWQATQQIRQAVENTKVLVVSAHEDPEYIHRVFAAGASGFVLKRSASDELMQALRIVRNGNRYIDPLIAEGLLEKASAPIREQAPAAHLTERELEVVRLIILGHSNKEIAARLNISTKTVETHKARSLEKLHLRTRADLVRFGISQGWLIDTSSN